MDEAPANSARVTPRASADWFRGLDKVFAPLNIFYGRSRPSRFRRGPHSPSLFAEAPGCPASPVSSENVRRPLRPSTHTLAHAVPSRVSRLINVLSVSIRMSTLSFFRQAPLPRPRTCSDTRPDHRQFSHKPLFLLVLYR